MFASVVRLFLLVSVVALAGVHVLLTLLCCGRCLVVVKAEQTFLFLPAVPAVFYW